MRLALYVVLLLSCLGEFAFAQVPPTFPPSTVPPTTPSAGVMSLDSLRAKEESGEDSITYTAKYVRYTNLQMFREGTQTIGIDTTIRNFQHYSPINQPDNPTIGLGINGIAYREMLFRPAKTIGFDPGFHSLDLYRLTQDSVRFYRARSPYTELYYVNGRINEQTFKVTHSQNVKPNLNVGANFNRLGGDGFYKNQKFDHLNAALFTWYESRDKRYNILADAVFNTLKAGENGSVLKDTIFNAVSTDKAAERVRLSAGGADRPQQTWRRTQLMLSQYYYIGRRDSLPGENGSERILPTQRVSHTVTYTKDRYAFRKNEDDIYGAFPVLPSSSFTLTHDSTEVSDLRNEFTYSFYLRGKAVSFIKNEVKLDLGLQNDLYRYRQMGYSKNFSNTMLKASIGYRFSDRVRIEADLHQIVQGNNFGDFLYEARTNFSLGQNIGRVVLGAYTQNKSPEQMFERVNYQYHAWSENFDKSKINNLSFLYQNDKIRFSGKAEYYLVGNYLYYRETTSPQQIEPAQSGTNINVLKITVQKDFRFGKFNLDNHIVYQKTDFQDIIRTPEIYTYNSFYYGTKLFRVLTTDLGFDVRFNTPFKAPAYAINVSQFYNDNRGLEYSTYPVADVWIRATLKRANLLLKYDYANRDLFSRGFYTVRGYPMHDRLLKFAVSWKFYN